MSEYADRDIIGLDELGGYYFRHVCAMTSESLHSKSGIAAELGYRDSEIDRLTAENEELREENERLLFSSRHNVDMYEQMNDARKEAEQERDQLKSVLQRFMELDIHDPDLKGDLWCLQQEEAPNL